MKVFIGILLIWLSTLGTGQAQFLAWPIDVRPANVLFEGDWVSCPDEHEPWEWGELSYQYSRTAHSPILWTLHLGPGDEFALFKGPVDDLPDHAEHDGLLNLLAGYHHNMAGAIVATRNWTVPTLKIDLSVSRVTGTGKAELNCQNFIVRVTRRN